MIIYCSFGIRAARSFDRSGFARRGFHNRGAGFHRFDTGPAVDRRYASFHGQRRQVHSLDSQSHTDRRSGAPRSSGIVRLDRYERWAPRSGIGRYAANSIAQLNYQQSMIVYGQTDPNFLNAFQSLMPGRLCHAVETVKMIASLVAAAIAMHSGRACPDGNLQDEDLPLVAFPCSSANGSQQGGKLTYGTMDAGRGWRSQEQRSGDKLAAFSRPNQIVPIKGNVRSAANGPRVRQR